MNPSSRPRFRLVDAITRLEPMAAQGVFDPAPDDFWRAVDRDGSSEIPPGIALEALGQLASWHCVWRTNFRKRPVVLFAHRIGVAAAAQPGATMHLSISVSRWTDDFCAFSGDVSADGRTLIVVDECGLFFMPLSDLESPEDARATLGRLCTPIEDGASAPSRDARRSGSRSFAYTSLIERIALDAARTSASFTVVLPPDAPFFPDHFPRLPVAPVTILNEAIGRVAAHLFRPPAATVARVRDLKIRRFVHPGERLVGRLERRDDTDAGTTLIGHLELGGERILRCQYSDRPRSAPMQALP